MKKLAEYIDNAHKAGKSLDDVLKEVKEAYWKRHPTLPHAEKLAKLQPLWFDSQK